jgi:SAM-dependent methyltransferase
MTILNPDKRADTDRASGKQAVSSSAGNYRYDDTFYRYIAAGSIRSASIVVPLLLNELAPASVLDVGCGAGAWLSQCRILGIADYLGVDGAYVERSSLLVPAEHFHSQDVTQTFDLGRRFDLVQCLEVGEHLPEAFSDTLVGNLTRHGDRVLFSAATPGQGGENHINEQTHEFWRLLFARRGYKPFDFIRPMIKGIAGVESWYRRNIILYVAETAIPALSPIVRHSAIHADQTIPQVGSMLYRVQARVVSLLPMRWVSKIALAKHAIIIACRSLRKSNRHSS